MTALETTNPQDDSDSASLPAAQRSDKPATPESETANAVELEATTTSERRPRRTLVLAVVAVCLIGAVAAFALQGNDSAANDSAAEPATIRAVVAEQRDLIEYTDLDGTLGYASTVQVNAKEPGVITAAVSDGAQLVRGDHAVEVDAEPVVVFYGELPFYRTMNEGVVGDDVLILEQNLASLGFHATEDDEGEQVNEDFSVDGVFDVATTAAVNRWQADLGVEQTGVVDPADAVVISGPAIAVDPLDKATEVQQGATLVSMHVIGSQTSLYSEHAGELELAAPEGLVEDGSVLYVVDGLPITALVVESDADLVFDRELFEGVVDGDDVREVEEMLATLGYDARGDLDIDDEFDEHTTEAIEDWKEDLQDEWPEVVADGTFRPEDVVMIEPGTVIEGAKFADQQYRAQGAEVFETASSSFARIVTTRIDVADQGALVEGMDVTVEFPDGETVTGVVSAVAGSSTRDLTIPNAEPEFEVEITLAAVPASAERFSELDVEVKIAEQIAEAVTVVPASALVVTSNGYAVEVVEGSATQFVAVEPGLFADGFVEVDGIGAGTAVVVPS